MDIPSDPSLLPAATRFLELEGSRRPDFSGCIVLIPHHHMGVDFRLALRRAMPEPVLLPPRLLTIPDLARTAPLGATAAPDSKRLAELHDFLARTGHLRREGLWQAARELLELLEEMDRAQVTLDGATAGRALDQGQGNPYLGLEVYGRHWARMRRAGPVPMASVWLGWQTGPSSPCIPWDSWTWQDRRLAFCGPGQSASP